jgi:hypothetical protein
MADIRGRPQAALTQINGQSAGAVVSLTLQMIAVRNPSLLLPRIRLIGGQPLDPAPVPMVRCVRRPENGPPKVGLQRQLPGERQGYADGGDYDRCRDERRASPAFQKRNLRRSDDMDDERLSEQGFNEPPGLKQRWISPGVQAIEHHEIRNVIEDRTDRADGQHKFRDIADVPSPLAPQGIRRRRCR